MSYEEIRIKQLEEIRELLQERVAMLENELKIARKSRTIWTITNVVMLVVVIIHSLL